MIPDDRALGSISVERSRYDTTVDLYQAVPAGATCPDCHGKCCDMQLVEIPLNQVDAIVSRILAERDRLRRELEQAP